MRFLACILLAVMCAGCGEMMLPPGERDTKLWKIDLNASTMEDVAKLTLKSPNLSHIDPMRFPTLAVRCGEKAVDVWFEAGWPAELELYHADEASVRYRLDSAKAVSLYGATANDRQMIRLGGADLVRDMVAASKISVEYTPYKFHAVSPTFDLTGLRAAFASGCASRLG